MNRYVINIVASQDLAAISDYFYTHNIEAGERFLQEFSRKCKQLANFPSLGRSYADIEPDLRGIPLESSIIFYRVIEDGIEIMRVVSGRRDLSNLFPHPENE